jgi:hypothetical protein
MEITYVHDLDHAAGTQIGTDYELRWRLDDTRLELELNRRVLVSVELGEADFFDLYASPFFNSLPVLRDGLLAGGPARDYVMSLIQVPALTSEPSNQRYEPRGARQSTTRPGRSRLTLSSIPMASSRRTKAHSPVSIDSITGSTTVRFEHRARRGARRPLRPHPPTNNPGPVALREHRNA